jgi:predicted DNA-binding protein (MmcQ/YjbR family)
MEFTRRLRAGVQRGEITCSVRIWLRPHVKPGHRYSIEGGEIEVDSIEQIELADITPELARESGFVSVIDLLKIAKHGRGSNVYLVRFHFIPGARRSGRRAVPIQSRKKKPSSARQRARVVRILERLPEAAAVARNTHLSLEVRKKRFGYFLDDHQGDGRIAICCKASADLRDMLQQNAPSLLHVPKYVGNKGWIGLWLDGDVDWSAVEVALREAYRLVAPKALTRAT